MGSERLLEILKGLGTMYLRHDDHAEIQPVPWIPQEGEWSDAESSSQNFYR